GCAGRDRAGLADLDDYAVCRRDALGRAGRGDCRGIAPVPLARSPHGSRADAAHTACRLWLAGPWSDAARPQPLYRYTAGDGSFTRADGRRRRYHDACGHDPRFAWPYRPTPIGRAGNQGDLWLDHGRSPAADPLAARRQSDRSLTVARRCRLELCLWTFRSLL